MTEKEITLSELVDIQYVFDATNFFGADTPEGKRRHIYLHLGKLMGKFSGLEEQADHGHTDAEILTTDIIPDLLVYAAQLAELGDVDLQDAYRARLKFVAERNGFAPQTVDSLFDHSSE